MVQQEQVIETRNKEVEITLFDLPKNRFFVTVNKEFNNKLFYDFKKKFPPLYKACKNILGISNMSLYSWHNKQRYPLSILARLTKILNLDTKKVQKQVICIQSGKYPSKGRSTSKKIKPNFPIKLSKSLIRIIAHLFADGVLGFDKQGFSYCAYYNQNKLLRDSFKKDIANVFGISNLAEGINKTTPYIYLPTPIVLILSQIVTDFSSKNFTVPNFIKKSPKHIKREFIKSFLDDEAHVRYSPPHRHIEISLSNQTFLIDLKNLLTNFNISSTKIYHKKIKHFDIYYFYIRTYKNIKQFYDQINFNHPHKKEKLQKIISNPGRKHYSHGETKQEILSILKKRPYTIKELSKVLKRAKCTTSHFLNILKKENKVEVVGFKKTKFNNKIHIIGLLNEKYSDNH